MNNNIVGKGLTCQITFSQCLIIKHNEPICISMEQGRKWYGFIHTLKGHIEYRFSDSTPSICIQAGQTIYIPKGCKYVLLYPAEETVAVVLNFDIAPHSIPKPPQNAALLSANTERLFRDFANYRAFLNPFRCAARSYDLLDILLRDPPAVPKKYRRIQPALEHLENNPFSDADVDFYANLCGMSPSGFRRSFRDYIGMPPIEYRNNLRLNYARILLDSGEYSIEEAAHQSGFSNVSFFYRLFRRKFGISPGKL